MSEPTVLLDIEGPVATVTLNRPEALNALTPPMLVELNDRLSEARDRPGVQVLVLTGAGRAFSAGVDLKALGQVSGGDVDADLNGAARAAIDTMVSMDQVVVAKINGYCFTGALELALACDLMICASEAQLGDTHAQWGLRPTWGMSQRLVAAVGITRARELSYTARRFTGAEAAQWGLAIRAVPADELDAAVAELASTVAANSPGSCAAYKDLYRAALDHGLSDGLAYEATTSYAITDATERVSGFKR